MNRLYTYLIIILGLILGYITTTGTKSQWIRLIDIFIIGPLMIYIGYKYNTSGLIDTIAKIVLIFFGSTTITYNARNFFYELKSKK
jgi:hypothetical protein